MNYLSPVKVEKKKKMCPDFRETFIEAVSSKRLKTQGNLMPSWVIYKNRN